MKYVKHAEIKLVLESLNLFLCCCRGRIGIVWGMGGLKKWRGIPNGFVASEGFQQGTKLFVEKPAHFNLRSFQPIETVSRKFEPLDLIFLQSSSKWWLDCSTRFSPLKLCIWPWLTKSDFYHHCAQFSRDFWMWTISKQMCLNIVLGNVCYTDTDTDTDTLYVCFMDSLRARRPHNLGCLL